MNERSSQEHRNKHRITTKDDQRCNEGWSALHDCYITIT